MGQQCGCFAGLLGESAPAAGREPMTPVSPRKESRRQLQAMKAEIWKLCDSINCNPILIRLAWHDSGTFDQRISAFPQRGGANGAIIHGPEINMGANAGLAKAVKYLEPIKAKYPKISWADCIQMASATAIEHAGGPSIDMKYGRVDVRGPQDCAPPKSRQGFGDNAGLPDAKPPFGCGAVDPATHLRNVFTKKMGFNDEEIVALSGAHTLGRAFKERSGTCPFGYGENSGTKYTNSKNTARADGKAGIGMAGGQSWTSNWLTFDNAYYKEGKKIEAKNGDEHLLWFPTDHCLLTDAYFKPHFNAFAADQNKFFESYRKAHKKLSELGAQWSDECVSIEDFRR